LENWREVRVVGAWTKFLIPLFLLLPVTASASFLFTGEGRFQILTREISYRFDDSGSLDIQQAIADNTGWISQESTPYVPSRTSVILWAKFDLPIAPESRRILVDTSPWERADFYVVRDGRVVDRQTSGVLVPRGERTTNITMNAVIFHSGFAAVDLPAHTAATMFARLETSSRFAEVRWLRFYLWDAERVGEAERHDRILQGLFYGAMLFLIVYNLGLFVVSRELSFLFYVIMELGYVVLWGVVFGVTFEFLWPGRPEWEYRALHVSAATGGFGLCQFLRYYLETWKHMPRMDTLLKWSAYFNLLVIPVLLLLPMNFEVISKAMTWSVPLGVPVILFIIVRAMKLRHPMAGNMLVTMLCFTAGILVFAGVNFEILPVTDLTVHAAQIGSALAGVVLSIGLGQRWQHARMDVADLQLKEERNRSAHEREKRELAEEHNRGLEAKVEERTAELIASQRQSDLLLANILPRAIIDELKMNGVSEPRRHEETSILFTDFSGFTQAVSTIPAKRLVQELDEIFRGFDDIVTANGLEKIKTIGDAYMVASGMPVASADHAVRCVRAGLAFTQFIEERNRTAAMKWGLRVGVHSGAVVAGIVGKNKYAYDVWGDTVNIASRLESAGEVNKVNISAYTYELVRDHFECEYRGKLAAKGKGEIDMYFVLREKAAPHGEASPLS
jgi:class 3 adenylate cyclase